MKSLQSGIRIVDLVGTNNKARVKLSSSGTVRAYQLYGQSYAPQARVPSGGWRQLTSEEENLLLLGRTEGLPPSEHESVFIFRSPQSWLRQLQRVGELLQVWNSALTVNRFAGSQHMQEVNNAMYDMAVPFVRDCSGLRVQGLFGSSIGLCTSTLIAPPDMPFIGLHRDSFERRGSPDIQLDPVRLCLNLGLETRYFLFVNLSVSQIKTKLDLVGSGDDISSAFLETYPQYPVCRLALEPGEAYLAPVANLIHDSTSLSKSMVDVSYGVVGRFDPLLLSNNFHA